MNRIIADLPNKEPLSVAALPTKTYSGSFRRSWAPKKSRKRFLGNHPKANVYHVMSRTAGGAMVFGDQEKEAFVRIMRRLERFSGVEILTYAVMGNHFHLLVRVPNQETFLARFDGPEGELRLMEHLRTLYSAPFLRSLQQELHQLREHRLEDEAQALLNRFKGRICDLGIFVKEIKERFTRAYNKQNGRRGTLWMDRYKSVIVGDGEALRTIACYIDLNPVRAGLVDDPKDYRWSGYAEAVVGSKRARRGLCRVMERPLDSWDTVPLRRKTDADTPLIASDLYRVWLFGQSEERTGEVEHRLPDGTVTKIPTGKRRRRGLKKTTVEQVTETDRGHLSRAALLRSRVRYFSDGVAIGGKAFVEGVFEANRDQFGPKRKRGANRIRESEEANLFSLRALRLRAVE